MIAAFKVFKHGVFKMPKFPMLLEKRNPMLTASDYVVQLFFLLLNFPALETVGDNSHLCEPQSLFFFITN